MRAACVCARAAQIRVVQGKEPSHFCSVFQGHMIVHSGGIASAFDAAHGGAEAAAAVGGNKLYHVKGTTPSNTKAVEVEATAANLNSGDCFVLKTDAACYVWTGHGSRCDGHLRRRATVTVTFDVGGVGEAMCLRAAVAWCALCVTLL
jgi:hypothetical protein